MKFAGRGILRGRLSGGGGIERKNVNAVTSLLLRDLRSLRLDVIAQIACIAWQFNADGTT